MSREAFSPQQVPAEPAARPVDLHGDLYREIFSHSKEAIAIIDPEGYFLQQNGAHFVLLGYADDDLEGQTPAVYLGEETFQKIFKRLVEKGDYAGETVCRNKNGEELNIEVSVFTMRSGLGEPLCYVSIQRDVTARKRTEEKLAQLLVRERAARADAEKANRLKDEFLATLSHELRTPLNAVIGWSRILKAGRLDNESSLHAIEVIERNAWAQKQIIEDILDVSRVITGKLQLHLGPVDLIMVVNAALDAVRPAFEAKDIRIETHYQQRLKVIAGDADRLQQVVWNLLSNASKFTPVGGVVSIRVVQDNNYVTIEVKDTGPGIAAEFLPHVFERFRQADGSTTRTHGGLGLGLAIVRHLVELHGGLIAAENVTNGSGAVFTVKLPLPSAELTLDHAPAATRLGETLTEVDLENVRILVVEDELDALDLLTIDLAAHGAKVRGAASAAEALSLLRSNEFDLLISDIGMADTDGYNLIKQVRDLEGQEGEHIPAIALTAYAHAQDRMRAIDAGYNTHVAKPVEIKELVTVVKCLTGKIDSSPG
ncbi:MAG TPA: ATP-binding protein [Pyrinomonadaceae bacterium]|jgi:PAS domain S-box-containing protein|nr:ATP-binding protein [Pyrinomonadaceae bacterium]